MASEEVRQTSRLGDVQKALVVGVLGWIAIQSARTSLFPLLPVVGKDFALSGAEQGAIVSAYFILYVGMQIPAGIIGDRIGLKRVIVIMSALAGVALVALGILSSSYWLLIAFVAMAGLGSGGFYPSAFAMVMNSGSASKRGRNSAILTMGMCIGVALGLWIATPLVQWSGNWRMPSLVTAVLVFGAALLAQALLRNRAATVTGRSPIGGLLRNRNFVLLNLIAFLFSYGSWAALTWGPTFFAAKGLSLSVSAIYTSIIVLAALPSGLVIGRFSDRAGRRPVTLVMFAVSAVTLSVMAYVSSPVLLFVVLAFYGFVSNYAWNPIGVAWAADLVSASNRECMGAAIGVLNFSSVAPAIIAPIVSGWLMDITHSLEVAFYLGSVLTLVAIVLAVAIRETKKSAQELPEEVENGAFG